MRKPSPRKVAILYPASIPWFARSLDGIRRYAREGGDWQVYSSPPVLPSSGDALQGVNTMRGWKGDGMIISSNEEGNLLQARQLGIPVINLAAGLAKNHGVPRVLVDNYQAGSLAADHLIGRGLKQLAFFGWNDQWYSQRRRIGFMERAQAAGAGYGEFLWNSRDESKRTWISRIHSIARWLESLPRPCGIFAVHDYSAQLLIDATQECNVRIPEDLAVIGLDNNEILCEHSIPTLSSVSCNSELVGWEAAALLDRMMQGQAPPENDLELPPDGVVSRQSTDMLYCSDPLVSKAIEYIRMNLRADFNVEAIADHVGVSKRTLETRFRLHSDTSPHESILRLRVLRAQALMKSSPDLTNEQVAAECGFKTCPPFYAAFQRVTGQTPASFRKESALWNTV